jgi:5-hydroxyisourate hydrolase
VSPSLITTHVLDTALGRPAAGVGVTLLQVRATGGDEVLATASTDANGRIDDLGPDHLDPGEYRLLFATADYHARTGQPSFFPEVAITFNVDEAVHHHVPMLLSPYAYSTYRGS